LRSPGQVVDNPAEVVSAGTGAAGNLLAACQALQVRPEAGRAIAVLIGLTVVREDEGQGW
jgi:hypothetical protein